jgi:hypothetical protein
MINLRLSINQASILLLIVSTIDQTTNKDMKPNKAIKEIQSKLLLAMAGQLVEEDTKI